VEIKNVAEIPDFSHPGWKRDRLFGSRGCPGTAAISTAGLLVRTLVHVGRRLVVLVDMSTHDGADDGCHGVYVPLYVFLA
jgi:hypothetical protein